MVNSDPLHKESWEVLMKRYGYNFYDIPEKIRNGFIGIRIIDVLEKVIEYFKIKTSPEELSKHREKIFLKAVKEKLEPMPGLFKSLNLFKNKFKIAIASSGTKVYLDRVIEKFNIKDNFNVVISGDDVKFGKPNPEIYLLTSRRLGLKPEECLVLEDSTHGIEAAKSAGCRCIAIRNSNTLPQDISRADIALNSLNEINFDVLKKL